MAISEFLTALLLTWIDPFACPCACCCFESSFGVAGNPPHFNEGASWVIHPSEHRACNALYFLVERSCDSWTFGDSGWPAPDSAEPCTSQVEVGREGKFQ